MITSEDSVTENTEETTRMPKSKTTRRQSLSSPSIFEGKEELESCNNRLERYVAYQKSKDKKINLLEKRISELENSLANEKERIRNSIKKSFDHVRKEKISLEAQLGETKSELEKIQSGWRNSETELKSRRELLKNSEKRLMNFIKLRRKDMAIMNRLNSLVRKYKSETLKNSKEAELSRTESESLRTERDGLGKELRALKEKKEQKESDVYFSDATYKGMVSSYEREIRKLKKKMSDIEESIRVEFSEQLNDSLKSRQVNFNREKTKALIEATKVYETKVIELKEQLEATSDELEKTKREFDLLENNYESEKDEKELLTKNLEAEMKRVSLLENKITSLKVKPIRKEQHNSHVLKLLKEAYKKKEVEFENLQEMKVSLMVEIQFYRDILDKEEVRHGLLKTRSHSGPAPVKKTGKKGKRVERKAEKSLKSENEQSLDELQRELEEDTKETKTQTLKKGSPKKRTTRSRRSSGRPEGVLQQASKKMKTQLDDADEVKKGGSKASKGRKKKPTRGKTDANENPVIETAGMDIVLECYATRSRIEIKNNSPETISVKDWRLAKEGQNGVAAIGFPDELKQNETFYVYPSTQTLQEDSSEGVKRLWNEKAFRGDNGKITIFDQNGEEMYKFEVVEKEDEE